MNIYLVVLFWSEYFMDTWIYLCLVVSILKCDKEFQIPSLAQFFLCRAKEVRRKRVLLTKMKRCKVVFLYFSTCSLSPLFSLSFCGHCTIVFSIIGVKILNTINWTDGLNKYFKENEQKDPSLLWQYFGSSNGVYRVYPGQIAILMISFL